jgi:hypothetical protein
MREMGAPPSYLDMSGEGAHISTGPPLVFIYSGSSVPIHPYLFLFSGLTNLKEWGVYTGLYTYWG